MKYLILLCLAFFLCACSPSWWPFEAKVAEDVIEDVDQELKCETPAQPKPLMPPFLPTNP